MLWRKLRKGTSGSLEGGSFKLSGWERPHFAGEFSRCGRGLCIHVVKECSKQRKGRSENPDSWDSLVVGIGGAERERVSRRRFSGVRSRRALCTTPEPGLWLLPCLRDDLQIALSRGGT